MNTELDYSNQKVKMIEMINKIEAWKNYELVKCTCKNGCKKCNYKKYVKMVIDNKIKIKNGKTKIKRLQV